MFPLTISTMLPESCSEAEAGWRSFIGNPLKGLRLGNDTWYAKISTWPTSRTLISGLPREHNVGRPDEHGRRPERGYERDGGCQERRHEMEVVVAATMLLLAN